MQLKKPDVKKCKNVFTKANETETGKLKPLELVNALKEFNLNFTVDELRDLNPLVSTSPVITLSVDQFIHLIYIIENTTTNDTTKMMFLSADTTQSGTINRAGVESVLKKMGASPKTQQIDELMEALADNKDGTLSYEAFKGLIDGLMG
ncbi:EF_hand domain-containing protein [Hexamita inflata]|uniref:EF hand domain-containing protein n=1 Tax=Hexamita inflata TaxID=28002 RepID=A0AA86PLF5_9EUKA|nr:EF hand domain-containing protein [Hexamita inflata]